MIRPAMGRGIWLWVLNFLTNNYCNTFKGILCFCCVKQEIKTMKLSDIIGDLIGVIAIFGTLYAGLIIGHGIGL